MEMINRASKQKTKDSMKMAILTLVILVFESIHVYFPPEKLGGVEVQNYLLQLFVLPFSALMLIWILTKKTEKLS
ncbi:hypothetical protein IT400_03885 [Candidatus Nomurabacteria bacterium]|nr:hypothetical protein [Candidatus Nomurabacteria bacterium]